MPIPQNKNELLEAIAANYEKLYTELEKVPALLAKKKELEGHAKNTRMSVHDLVAYLNGWGQLILKWNDRKSKNLEVDFPETGYKWNQLGELAQKFYKDYEKDDYNTLKTRLDKTVKEIIKVVESKSNKELYGTHWFDKWTPGRLIQLNTSSPYTNARGRIRKWKKLKGIK